MKRDDFQLINGKAPNLITGVQDIVVVEFEPIIDLDKPTPSSTVLRQIEKQLIYADVHSGDCEMGLLLKAPCLWGAYRCLGSCEFVGAWCWILTCPYSFGLYSEDARATYYRGRDDETWRACAHHSLTMDVAIYSVWQAVETMEAG